MTDQTKCPHCGAGKSPEYRHLRFDCGTIMCDNEVARSSQCELKTLRAKVAAQQELLKEAAQVLADSVDMLECGDDWNSTYVQELKTLHAKLEETK